MTSILEHIKSEGHDVDALMLKIKQLFVMTFASSQPILAHVYRSCQPDDHKNQMCFEILGMDVMLDHKMRPSLLEINHTPSFSTDTPFDYDLKHGLIEDTIKLLGFNENDKVHY
jgi:tubulin polyglutamylase TTLL6/13